MIVEYNGEQLCSNVFALGYGFEGRLLETDLVIARHLTSEMECDGVAVVRNGNCIFRKAKNIFASTEIDTYLRKAVLE